MHENFPLISIIVPVYKVEKYLPKCIESILDQTFTDWELLLIDDGSPDKSGEICDEYALKDARIKVLHKDNGGVSSARNLGLEKAKGEWVTFVDSDDFIQPGFLEGLYAPIALGENLDFVQGGCVNVRNEEIISINQSYEYYVGDDSNILFQKFRGLTVSKLFRLENVKHRPDGLPLLFDEEMRIAEDMAFTLDYILYVNRYAFVPEKGYCYRVDNVSSATKSKRIEKYETALHSFRHLYSSVKTYIQKFQLSDDVARLRLSHEASHLQNVCLLLYYNNFPRNKRLLHLKGDFEDEQLRLLCLVKKNGIYSILFSFLEKKRYCLFDTAASLLMHVMKVYKKVKE